jgi:hypothetical protein
MYIGTLTLHCVLLKTAKLVRKKKYGKGLPFCESVFKKAGFGGFGNWRVSYMALGIIVIVIEGGLHNND